MKNKISFDFDSTLSRKDVQKYAKELVDNGYEVWIVTSRCSDEYALSKGWHWVENQNQKLYEVAELVGIPRERIEFTNHVDKIEFLKDKEFIFHLDDDVDELIAIMESGDSCKQVNVDHFEWLESCEKILKNCK